MLEETPDLLYLVLPLTRQQIAALAEEAHKLSNEEFLRVQTETKTTDIKQSHTEVFKDSGLTHQTELQPIHTQRNLKMSKIANISKAIIAFSLLLSGTSFLNPKAALAGGGFAGSCNNLILYKQNPGMLYAHCRRSNGTWNNQARIQLSDWITNNNGHLGWQQNGGFLGSCDWNTDARATSGLFPTGLNQQFPVFIGFHAPCKNNAGAKDITPDLDLNERILNDNGDLKYGG